MAAFFDPFLEMARVQRDINRLFGDANRNYLDNYTAAPRDPVDVLLDVVIPSTPTDPAAGRTKDTSHLQPSAENQVPQQRTDDGQQLSLRYPLLRGNGMLMPRLDVWEKDHQTCVQVEVPGFAKDKLNIELSDGYLHVSGETKQEQKKEHHNLVHSERRFGSFKRSIRLPKNVKEEDIKASYNDGVLSITVPHAEPPKKEKRLINIMDGPSVQPEMKNNHKHESNNTTPSVNENQNNKSNTK